MTPLTHLHRCEAQRTSIISVPPLYTQRSFVNMDPSVRKLRSRNTQTHQRIPQNQNQFIRAIVMRVDEIRAKTSSNLTRGGCRRYTNSGSKEGIVVMKNRGNHKTIDKLLVRNALHPSTAHIGPRLDPLELIAILFNALGELCLEKLSHKEANRGVTATYSQC